MKSNCFFQVVLVIALISVSLSCAPPQEKPLRIGIAGFSHETCTFCPRPTGIEEWEYYGPPVRGEEMLERAQGFIKVLAGEEDRILGIWICGADASEQASLFGPLLAGGLTIDGLRDGLTLHPTLGEAALEAVLEID